LTLPVGTLHLLAEVAGERSRSQVNVSGPELPPRFRPPAPPTVVYGAESPLRAAQLTACRTSCVIRCSSAGVSLTIAQAVGHMLPSSRLAGSLKPSSA